MCTGLRNAITRLWFLILCCLAHRWLFWGSDYTAVADEAGRTRVAVSTSHHFQSFKHLHGGVPYLAKYNVFTIELGLVSETKEELRPICVWARVCH